MRKFSYKAKQGLSELTEGVIEADNREDALNKLIALGLFPISIFENAPAGKSQKAKNAVSRILSSGKVSSGDILNFTQKLTTLTRARVELLSSFKILYDQAESGKFKEVILGIYNTTKEGKPFSESLERYPKVFPPIFISIIKAGETSGRIDLALEQISEYLTREENLKNKVKVALAYPGLLLAVGLVSIFVLINFVIPKLKPLFEGMGRDLPFITKIVLNVSEFSNKTWWMIGGSLAIFIITLYYQKGSIYFRRIIRKIEENLPLLRRLIKNQELAHFSRSLGILLKSGVPALKSLEISILSIEAPGFRNQMKNVCKDVASGHNISGSMSSVDAIPSFFTKMIAVGEESGRLSEVLDEISRSYTQAVESDIALITSLLEPILILVMGSILGAIVLSILLPTFQITQMVH